MVAGLIVLLGVLSVGPVSRGFSDWACRFVGSILSRAEAAARYLVVAHAYRMIACSGVGTDANQISESLALAFAADDADVSLSACQTRLRVLRAVLMDVPRCASRLLRRIEKQARRAGRTRRPSAFVAPLLSTSLRDWRLAEMRIERPPDLGLLASLSLYPPPGNRAGGESG